MKHEMRYHIVPDGVLSVLPGFGNTTGKEIVSHPLVKKVDITVSFIKDFPIMHAKTEITGRNKSR